MKRFMTGRTAPQLAGVTMKESYVNWDPQDAVAIAATIDSGAGAS